MIYLALLRGINVGGNNKVDMKQLARTFESLGFENVKTYINSGNVIFENKREEKKKLALRIKHAIRKDFGLDVDTLVQDRRMVQETSSVVPQYWVNDTLHKTDILFLWDDLDAKKLCSKLEANSIIETLISVPGALIWHIGREQYTKSKVPKRILGKDVYKKMTIRNVNTLRKLNALMRG
jgi:uncharacterized protein (DUF1697 family)